MTSERKIAANRANGRISKGPKTIQGKHRSSKNALRHGLSLPLAADPYLRQGIETLAQEIASGNDSRQALGMARQAAESQIELVRIRRVRHELLIRACVTSPDSDTKDILPSDLIEQLIKIDRYERRAFSRRKTALRALNRID